MCERLQSMEALNLISAEELERFIKAYPNSQKGNGIFGEYHYYLDDCLWTVLFGDRGIQYQREQFVVEYGKVYLYSLQKYQDVVSVVKKEGGIYLFSGFHADAVLLYGAGRNSVPAEGLFLCEEEPIKVSEGCLISGNVFWAIQAVDGMVHATKREVLLANQIASSLHRRCGCAESCPMEEGCRMLKKIAMIPEYLQSDFIYAWIRMAVEESCSWLSGMAVSANL